MMGDPRRFSLVAEFVADKISKRAKIADVAAGKGYLSLALAQRGFERITSFEPSPRNTGIKGLNLRVHEFKIENSKPFDVLLGLHPDGATEEIICGAAKYDKKMFIIPCCAKTSRTPMWNTNNWKGWIDHLLQLCKKHHLRIERNSLPMDGRNIIIWTP